MHHLNCGCLLKHGCMCIYDWRAGALVATTPFLTKLYYVPGNSHHLQKFKQAKEVRGDGFGNSESRLKYEYLVAQVERGA